MLLQDMSVKDFIDALANSEPAPGGGSAAAAAGAMAAGLILMVIRGALKKKENKKIEERLIKAFPEVNLIKESLVSLVDLDAEAYRVVVKSFKLPKENNGQREERHAAIQESYKNAALIPAQTADHVNRLIEIIENLKDLFPKSMASDAGMAKLSANAALKGAILNVEINLKEIEDEEFKEKLR